MKNIALVLFASIITLNCFGQSLFFDSLSVTRWTSSSNISASNIKSFKEIPLTRIIDSGDSINEDVTIWTFRDSILTLVQYSVKSNADSILGEYRYVIDNNSVLLITFENEAELTYKVGIISDGNYAVLFRIREKILR